MSFQALITAISMLGASLVLPVASAAGNGSVALQQAVTICSSGKSTPQRILALREAGWKIIRDETRIISNLNALYLVRSIKPGATERDLREANEFAAMLAEDGSDGLGVDAEMLQRNGAVVLVDDYINDNITPEPACYILGGGSALQAAVVTAANAQLTNSDRWRWQANGKIGGTRISAYGIHQPMLERLAGLGISLPQPATATFVTED